MAARVFEERTMDVKTFHDWCNLAVEKIRYSPDREAVYTELKAHMEDRYDAYRELGLSDSEATERTLKAMGDARTIAPQLAQIHRPFWGYLYSICRTLCKLLAIVVISLSVGGILDALDSALSSDIYAALYDPYTEVSFSDNQQSSTRLHHSSPNVSHTDSGYKITLTDAAHWETDWTTPNQRNSDFYYFRFQINCWPWAEDPTFCDWIWAEDSLGNIYYSDRESLHFYDNEELHIESNSLRVTPFTSICSLRIWEYQATDVGAIEWFDLHYDRGGRDLVFRADLTGGGGDA